jgi:hypothetical protein
MTNNAKDDISQYLKYGFLYYIDIIYTFVFLN